MAEETSEEAASEEDDEFCIIYKFFFTKLRFFWYWAKWFRKTPNVCVTRGMAKILAKFYAENSSAMINDFTDETVFNMELIGENEHTTEGCMCYMVMLLVHEDVHKLIHWGLGDDNFGIDDEWLVHRLAPIHWSEEQWKTI